MMRANVVGLSGVMAVVAMAAGCGGRGDSCTTQADCASQGSGYTCVAMQCVLGTDAGTDAALAPDAATAEDAGTDAFVEIDVGVDAGAPAQLVRIQTIAAEELRDPERVLVVGQDLQEVSSRIVVSPDGTSAFANTYTGHMLSFSRDLRGTLALRGSRELQNGSEAVLDSDGQHVWMLFLYRFVNVVPLIRQYAITTTDFATVTASALTQAGTATAPQPFGPVDMAFGPDGTAYVATNGRLDMGSFPSARVIRISADRETVTETDVAGVGGDTTDMQDGVRWIAASGTHLYWTEDRTRVLARAPFADGGASLGARETLAFERTAGREQTTTGGVICPSTGRLYIGRALAGSSTPDGAGALSVVDLSTFDTITALPDSVVAPMRDARFMALSPSCERLYVSGTIAGETTAIIQVYTLDDPDAPVLVQTIRNNRDDDGDGAADALGMSTAGPVSVSGDIVYVTARYSRPGAVNIYRWR